MPLSQQPLAGTHLVRHVGEIFTLTLRVTNESGQYEAFVRTNIGSFHAWSENLQKEVEGTQNSFRRVWNDVDMVKIGEGVYQATFPLLHVGVYEFKSYLFFDNCTQKWCEGENINLKVEPAVTYNNNTIYNAFVRQFGPNCAGKEQKVLKQLEELMEKEEYTIIPRSGHFRDFGKMLPHVMGTLGFRMVMLLPIHPVPTTFAKMGRYGSPFAATNFYDVDPAMAEFDQRTTPLEQFVEVVDRVHSYGGQVMLDFPLDHTGWASMLQVRHPEWFCRNPDGTFESPGAWGVTWADLCKLDFSKKEVWIYFADVLLHWCRLGVDGFRCDAGYMVARSVWQYVIGKVRCSYPDTLFLLEGLGGSWDVTRDLMHKGGMNWAYSESFQTFGVQAERNYLGHSLYANESVGLLVNFAETHDNNRLAATSKLLPALRIGYSALLSPAGAYGITNGMEWLATEKIDVHGASSLNWGASENIVDFIRRINMILKYHPAFTSSAELIRLDNLQGEAVGLLRKAGDDTVLVLENPSLTNEARVSWEQRIFDCGERPIELVTETPMQIKKRENRCHVIIPAATTYCISRHPLDEVSPVITHWMEYRAMTLRCMTFARNACYGKATNDITNERLEAATYRMMEEPEAFINECFEDSALLRVVQYIPSRDVRRVVPVPLNNMIYLSDTKPFIVDFQIGKKVIEHAVSLPSTNGQYFACLYRLNKLRKPEEIVIGTLKFKIFEAGQGNLPTAVSGELLLGPSEEIDSVHLHLPATEINSGTCGLCANRHGTYSVARGVWGTVQSKYDALMAVNFTPDVPDAQRALLIRFRVWAQCMDYSAELGRRNLESFTVDYNNTLSWIFRSAGNGTNYVRFKITWHLSKEHNSGVLTLRILECGKALEKDIRQVRLIIRPDMDSRCIHDVTKALYGAENNFRYLRSSSDHGFVFAPDGHQGLQLNAPQAKFNVNGDWQYKVPLPVEAERGLDTDMDLFSPGYFVMGLDENARMDIHVQAWKNGVVEASAEPTEVLTEKLSLLEALRKSLDYFIVDRNEYKSVIAGYPWFLDWGRDTLICLRGIIAAGKMQIARDLIVQFASFESSGTLPNMIRGTDTSDRDTSDAPLWLFVAVMDYMNADPTSTLLEDNCNGRSLRQVLMDLLENLWNGASNGVKADQNSGLLYSRPHFTWMDTNYPACTPRTGYPVEIQALWINAMNFLVIGLESQTWRPRLDLARASFSQYFIREDGRGLVDCCHADTFTPIVQAKPDDAVRPNQLLAVTLDVVTDANVIRSILRATEALLIPGGIRSLDDRPVQYPQPAYDNGKMLNDPLNPYWGTYSGHEDSRRKPAYHNGTAWGWQMPLYCEALYKLLGQRAEQSCRDRLLTAAYVMANGCVGFIPEIYDGNAPHHRKGCVAQAWSMTEAYRVLALGESDSMLFGSMGSKILRTL